MSKRKRARTLGSTGAVHDEEAGKHLRVALVALQATEKALKEDNCMPGYREYGQGRFQE